jgi:hypothetical protein
MNGDGGKRHSPDENMRRYGSFAVPSIGIPPIKAVMDTGPISAAFDGTV